MNKIRRGMVFNYISVGVMAASGLIMTSAVRFFYDSASLGIFNESYAWYMILSQVSVWGIHMSVLKYVPEQNTKEKKGEVILSALVASLIVSVPLLAVSESVVLSLHNLVWRTSLIIALTGLPFLSFNKVLLNFINAILDLVGFAVLQSLRYLLLAMVLIVLSVCRINSDYLTMAFPVAEIIVFIITLIYIGLKKYLSGTPKKRWIYENLSFGTKILPSNMVLEMNSKVDVVCLGFLLKDLSQIGVYSYAILFTEGLYYVYFTLRRVINPKISNANANGILKEYIKKVQSYLKRYFFIGSTISLIAVEAAYFFTCLLFGSEDYYMGLVYILIIGLSMTINGKSIMWGDFLSQTGYPVEESKVNMLTIMSNIVANILLINSFGTIGAAIGTCISYFVYRLFQDKFIFKTSGVKL